MKKVLLLVLSFIMVTSMSWAQDRTISGKVTSADDGSTLPGVNVVVKGTTNGGVTDIDGNYKVSVPEEGGTLVFSFIGLESQEVEIGARSVIDVQMASDIQQLSEVVVTALGTKQNAREVTYANQTVNSESLLSSPQKNALEALRGKTAGVNLTTSSGSVGASTRIVLRGPASLTGNNNALIVVDGVAIDNSASIGGPQGNESGYADFGNRFNDLDPSNIESITILKGPSATSLYGSRGNSGVIVVTTKSGKKGKVNVNFSTTASMEKAYILLQRQDKWGQGILNPDGTTTMDSGENFSWGPAFDGVVRPWTSPVDADGDGTLEWLSRPYSLVENQLEDFFRTGTSFNNVLSFSGGDDRFTYFGSYSNTTQNGILENTDYERNNFVVNASGKLSDKLSSSLNFSYSIVDTNTSQEGGRAFEGQNPYASAIQAPTNIPYNELRDYNSPYHSFTGYYGSYTVNPYFILNEYTNNAKINNYLTSFSLTYNPIDALSFTSRIGVNYVTTNRVVTAPVYQYTNHFFWSDNLVLTPRGNRQGNTGSYSETLAASRNIDWTTTGSYTVSISDKIKLNALAGFNYFDIYKRNLTGSTVGGFVVPDVYNLANSSQTPIVTQNHSQKRILGLFGEANLSWDEKVFLKYTARNDWSSTLPVDNQSFFYNSISASAILSEMLGFDSSGPVNYLKLRTGYGTSGKDAGLYLLASTYNVNPTLIDYDGTDQNTFQINSPLNGQTTISKGTLIGNSSLKPEKTTTFEVGADISFLDNRIELNYTFYDAKSTDQIFIAQLPRSTGYSQTAINVGELQNVGHEITLTAVPVQLSNGFKWTANLAWAQNKNKVLKVSDETDELTIYSTGRDGVKLVARKGEPFGVWRGQAQSFTADGKPIVDVSGARVYDADDSTLGGVQPDWTGNFLNTFSWNGISLGVLFDVKQGGQFYSTTKFYTEFNGTASTTAINDRVNFVVPNSVVEDLDANGEGLGTYSPNTTEIDAYSYFNNQNSSANIINGSYIKLREVTLGYELPKSIVSRAKLSSVRINLFAKNLKFWVSDDNTFGDPEVTGPSGPSNAVGLESSQTPPQRSYGFNLNITL